MDFVEALKNENITEIRKSPKSDLHNHFVLGGNRQFIFNKTGYYIESLEHPITSMKEMDVFNNDIEELIDSFEEIHERVAPEVEMRLQIGLSRHCEILYLEDCLSHFGGHKEFYSIDLYGDEMAR